MNTESRRAIQSEADEGSGLICFMRIDSIGDKEGYRLKLDSQLHCI